MYLAHFTRAHRASCKVRTADLQSFHTHYLHQTTFINSFTLLKVYHLCCVYIKDTIRPYAIIHQSKSKLTIALLLLRNSIFCLQLHNGSPFILLALPIVMGISLTFHFTHVCNSCVCGTLEQKLWEDPVGHTPPPLNTPFYKSIVPVPVAARSKAWICARLIAGDCGFEYLRGHG